MRKTKKSADDAHPVARTISRIEADLQSLKDEYQVMRENLAAAQLAATDAEKAQRAAEAARDAAVARLAEVEQEIETERSIRVLAADKLREACELLDANRGRPDALQHRGVEEPGEIDADAALPVLDDVIAPGRLPRAVAAACADLVARGAATDIATALLHLAELGLQALGRATETPRSQARPEPLPSPG